MGRWTWFLAVLGIAGGWVLGAEDSRRPNVVFILADDLRWG